MSNNDHDPRHLETLDRDLGRLSGVNHATSYFGHPLTNIGISLIFIILAGLVAMVLFEILQIF